MKQKIFSNATLRLTAFVVVVQLSIASCQKNDFAIEQYSIEPTETKQFTEAAFPGQRGKSHKLRYNGNDIWVEEKGGWYIWQNDIAFSSATFDSLKNAEGSTSRAYRTDFHMNWPSGVVPYTIGSGFTSNEQALINAAISEWGANTSLTFVQRTSHSNYILFKKGSSGSGLFSEEVGMKGGQQIINLEGNYATGHIVHEIGHAIGFYHEQQRTDRGNFIIVHWDNIFPPMPLGESERYQFETYAEQGRNGTQFGTFDFNSIMLYSSFAFSDGVHPTMTLLDGVTTFGAQRIGLSTGDIEAATVMYGPPFMRLEYIQTSIIEQYSDLTEFVREEGNYNIKFYSDPACTIPFTLPADRTVYYGVFSSNSPGPAYASVTVPAGQHTYPIPTPYYYEYRSEYGNITFYTVSGASSAGGAWR